MLLQIVLTVYWLALATWFGGVLFIAMSAPVIFKTVQEKGPILPTVLSVNLENQHATLLSTSIVSGLFGRLLRIEILCAAAIFLALVAQWALLFDIRSQLVALITRTVLYFAATVLVLYNGKVLWPKINAQRDRYIENADDPDIANAAKDDFDRYHRESINVLMLLLMLLLGMILFSSSISAARPLI